MTWHKWWWSHSPQPSSLDRILDTIVCWDSTYLYSYSDRWGAGFCQTSRTWSESSPSQWGCPHSSSFMYCRWHKACTQGSQGSHWASGKGGGCPLVARSLSTWIKTGTYTCQYLLICEDGSLMHSQTWGRLGPPDWTRPCRWWQASRHPGTQRPCILSQREGEAWSHSRQLGPTLGGYSWGCQATSCLGKPGGDQFHNRTKYLTACLPA